MDALPEDWQAVPNEKEKGEEITRLTVGTCSLVVDQITRLCLHCVTTLRLCTDSARVHMKLCLGVAGPRKSQ